MLIINIYNISEAPKKIQIDLDSVGSKGELKVNDPLYVATVAKDAIVVPGKVNNALRLDNQQCVTITLNNTYNQAFTMTLNNTYDQAATRLESDHEHRDQSSYINDRDEEQILENKSNRNNKRINKWCLFDISDCSHGFYMSFWMKIRDNVAPKISIAVSSSISIVYFKSESIMTSHFREVKDPITNFIRTLFDSFKSTEQTLKTSDNEDNSHPGILVFDFKHLQNHAYCVIRNIQSDNWFYVEASWRKEVGLKVHLDRNLKCTSGIFKDFSGVKDAYYNSESRLSSNYSKQNKHNSLKKFIFGCPSNGNDNNDDTLTTNNDVAANERKSGKVFLDWIEIFFRDRDYLLAHEHLVRGWY